MVAFLSQQLILQAPSNKIIVVSDGFSNQEQVESSNPDIVKENLEPRHEEANTRIILHCVRSRASSIVVAARDTDVLVLLLAHFNKIPCSKVWTKYRISKNRKYIPIHTIAAQLDNSMLSTLTAFHALTGSDNPSFLAGHTKKSDWNVFMEHQNLLQLLGKGDICEKAVHDIDEFICRFYKCDVGTSIDRACSILFGRAHALEALPPRSDVLSFYINRAHYQASIWQQADMQYPMLPHLEMMG
ncbi:hypothetical protein Hamer_G007574 [Homarus americanus]|uniref:Uncharacterized protein n=1 Tax=Homarus americanus TaxID=6706 RepID=A0A8J5MR44_HOMAM|nr:hypothetical protein Hamer_G007574 [Homarus americanus]